MVERTGQYPKPKLGFLERMTNFGPEEKAKNSIDSIIELAKKYPTRFNQITGEPTSKSLISSV